MYVACGKCDLVFDDASCWTICPHHPLGASPEPQGFCRRCDLFPPCLCGHTERGVIDYTTLDNVVDYTPTGVNYLDGFLAEVGRQLAEREDARIFAELVSGGNSDAAP